MTSPKSSDNFFSTFCPANSSGQAYCTFECQPYVLSPDLSHNVPLPPKVFVAQGEKVVDHKGLLQKEFMTNFFNNKTYIRPNLTNVRKDLIAVSDSIEVDIVVIGREK